MSLQPYATSLQNSANIEERNTTTTFCFSFDQLPNNFYAKEFSINHEKASIKKKSKAHNSQPVQVPPQGPAGGTDTLITCMMQKPEVT